MSSPPSTPRFSVPMPMPRPGSSSSYSAQPFGQGQGQGQQTYSTSPRSSIDSHRWAHQHPPPGPQHVGPDFSQANGYPAQGDRSRRTSDASFHRSPDPSRAQLGETSGSHTHRPNGSSSHHGQYDQDGSGAPHRRGLPRITTSGPDGEEHEGGPQSAPVAGPLRSVDAPARSSSSPDPRAPSPAGPSNGYGASNSTSNPPASFSFPVPRPLSRPPSSFDNHQPFGAIPPRSSSMTDQDRVAMGGEGNAAPRPPSSRSGEPTAAISTSPGPPARELPSIHAELRPDEPGSSSRSSSSKSEKRASFQHHAERFQAQRQESYVAQGGSSMPGAPGPSNTPSKDGSGKDQQRQGRSRGEPTFCGHCSQQVHGQFVRAMGKVYHLNCFRCKVGTQSQRAGFR